jgi:hypothetical protein
MAAGVTSTWWTLADMVWVIEDWEAAQVAAKIAAGERLVG